MRRDARRRAEKENWWNNKKILTGGSIAVIAFAFIIGVTAFSNNDKNSASENKINSNQIISLVPEDDGNVTNTESASTQIGNSVEESAAAQNNTTNTNSGSEVSNTTNNANETKTNTTTNKTKSNTAASVNAEQTNIQTEKEVSFVWPVEGEILKAFSIDNLLYSATLDEWVTHNGIDIRADKTAVVKAAADGTVKSIKNDPRYGLTVVIEHDGDYKTVYSNLLTAEFVVEGEKVTQGQTIGTVGNTATFEISDDSHLHFELLKSSEYVDPTIYLK